jgi:integrase
MKVREMIEQYISYRKSLGEKFITNACILRGFVKYMGAESDVYSITMDRSESFLYAPTGKVTANWFCKHTALKGLFQWAMVRLYIDHMPLPEEKPKRLEHMQPYIYTNRELRALFESAMTYQKNRSIIYPECVRAILMFTYLLGLRIHETLSLRIRSIDLQNDLVTINESKFYKSRIEPFNEAVRNEIVHFLGWRKSQRVPISEDAYLFINRNGQPMIRDSFNDIFRRICEKAGIRRDDGAIYQPRIHDLRHTFAVNRLIAWYDAGENVQSLLPILSTYMGHTHLAYTSVYLTMTDRLLGHANDCFENYAKEGNYE